MRRGKLMSIRKRRDGPLADDCALVVVAEFSILDRRLSVVQISEFDDGRQGGTLAFYTHSTLDGSGGRARNPLVDFARIPTGP